MALVIPGLRYAVRPVRALIQGPRKRLRGERQLVWCRGVTGRQGVPLDPELYYPLDLVAKILEPRVEVYLAIRKSGRWWREEHWVFMSGRGAPELRRYRARHPRPEETRWWRGQGSWDARDLVRALREDA